MPSGTNSPAARLAALLNRNRLVELLGRFPRLTIALVGDLFLDRYLEIDATLDEPSVETGLTAYQVTAVRNSPGALGTVMNNLAALGVGRLIPVTVIGDDGEAYDLLAQLRRLPIDTRGIVQDSARQTPTYTKPMRRDDAGAWRELNRLDLRTRSPISSQTEESLLARLDEAFGAADGLIVLDQIAVEGEGVITPRVREHLAALSRATPGKLMFIDSRRHIGRFTFGVLKPNRAECQRAAEETGLDKADVVAAARWLARRTGRAVYLTRGEEGILLVEPDGSTTDLPAIPVSGPIDIVGAGDSTPAGIVAGLLSGATHAEAGMIGNLVASITIQQIGATGTATPQQVLGRWDEASK